MSSGDHRHRQQHHHHHHDHVSVIPSSTVNPLTSEFTSPVHRKIAGLAGLKMYPTSSSMDDGYLYRPAPAVPSTTSPTPPPPPPPRIDSVIQQIRRNLSLDVQSSSQQQQQSHLLFQQQQYNHQIHVLIPSCSQSTLQHQTPPELPVKLRPKNLSHGSTSYLTEDEDLPPPPPPLPLQQHQSQQSQQQQAIGSYRHHPSLDLSSSCCGTASSYCHNHAGHHYGTGSITSSDGDCGNWRDSRCSSWSGKHYSFSCPQHLCHQIQYSSPSISSHPNSPTDADDQDLSQQQSRQHPLQVKPNQLQDEEAFHVNQQQSQQQKQQQNSQPHADHQQQQRQPFSKQEPAPSSSPAAHVKQQQQQFVPTPTSLITSFNGYNLHDPGKPPLPPKKKSVMEYMQMVGTYRGPNDTAFNMYRHSMQVHHSQLQLQQQQQQNQNQQQQQQNPPINRTSGQHQNHKLQQQHLHLSSQTLRQVDKSFVLTQQHSLDSNLNVSTDSSLSSVSKSSSGCESMVSRSSTTTTSTAGQRQNQGVQYHVPDSPPPPPLPSKSINLLAHGVIIRDKVDHQQQKREFTDDNLTSPPPPPLPPKTFLRKKESRESLTPVVVSCDQLQSKQQQIQTQQQQVLQKQAITPPGTTKSPDAATPASSPSVTALTPVLTTTPAAASPTVTESPIRKKSASSNRIVAETKNLLSALARGRGGGSHDDDEEEDNSTSNGSNNTISRIRRRKSLLHELDVSQYLNVKSSHEDGPEIRGGLPDALLVKAAEVTQNEFLFQEAFLATFRTFVTPKEVIDKLLSRYNRFISSQDGSQKISRNSFVLLVRVVDDLCLSECTDELMNTLLTFVCQLVQRGDHALAKVLRNKTMEKMEARKAAQESLSSRVLLPSISVSIKVSSLLDFKSLDLAEQMTIIDSHLFAKIEVAEALVWAKDQREESIPNLTKFTEHFNSVSYWVRTRILQSEEQKERERICMKFIKIMRNLKKLSNFNSIFAILSALDSAPIRRLDWPRSIQEGMKEFASLIDSSSSFRAYRQVLADTLPPCIPYIGLILQDLTFVHIGNEDLLPDGNINFSKRWLQFNILDQMRRFRNSHYPLLKKNEEIVNFFNNFEDYLHEESLWQISESIKPRGGKK